MMIDKLYQVWNIKCLIKDLNLNDIKDMDIELLHDLNETLCEIVGIAGSLSMDIDYEILRRDGCELSKTK